MTSIAITGGTGFIGQYLVPIFDRVHVLTRNPEKASDHFQDDRFSDASIECFKWDPSQESAPAEAFDSIDAVVHLAGESVQGRWTNAKKQRIRDSRVVGTNNLVDGLRALQKKPSVLIGGSAVGYYGDCGDLEVDESHPPADDFLGSVSVQWEAAANRATEIGMRVVNLRTGIVLGQGGGALQAMLPAFKFGLGARIAAGDQYFPWIHVDDICQLIRFAIEGQQEVLSGPVNGTAPQPVTNAEFTKALAGQLGRPAFWPAPAWALKLALGEFSSELLSSKRVIPRAALAAGFEFQFPELRLALADLLES